MYIYNTTYLVAEDKLEQWLAFIKPNLQTVLIQELGFESLSIMKLLSHQQNEGYVTMAVQARTKTLKKIDQWQALYEPQLKAEVKRLFGEGALPFSTLMQEV